MSQSNQREIDVPEPGMTAGEMLRRARDIVPWLREKAAEMEIARRMTDEVNERLMNAGFYRILQPRRFGGYEFDLRTYSEVVTELVRGDGSAGWIACFAAAHSWWVAQLPEQGQIEVFGTDGDFRAPIGLAPQGVAKPVAGGYVLDGDWDYCSACDVSNWLGLIALSPGERADSPPADVIMAVIPADEYRIEDNWHVLGLRGTGSKRAIVEQVFVPNHRAASFLALTHEYRAPGHNVHPNPLYRLPLYGIACVEIGSIAVGLACAGVDGFIEHLGGKRLIFPPFNPLKAERRAQSCLGRASARLEAAKAGLSEIVARQEARLSRVDNDPPFTDIEIRRDLLLLDEVMRLSLECVDIAFGAAGTSAARNGALLERVFRDISMMRTHYFVDAARTGENFGALSFGLPPYSDL